MRRPLRLLAGWEALLVGAVGAELPRLPVVVPHEEEQVTEGLAVPGILDRGDRFDAPVEIAGHPVGRADVDLLVAAVQEVERARVLQESPYDADHPDRAAHAGEPRAQAADSADDEIDWDTGLRRLVQRG